MDINYVMTVGQFIFQMYLSVASSALPQDSATVPGYSRLNMSEKDRVEQLYVRPDSTTRTNAAANLITLLKDSPRAVEFTSKVGDQDIPYYEFESRKDNLYAAALKFSDKDERLILGAIDKKILSFYDSTGKIVLELELVKWDVDGVVSGVTAGYRYLADGSKSKEYIYRSAAEIKNDSLDKILDVAKVIGN